MGGSYDVLKSELALEVLISIGRVDSDLLVVLLERGKVLSRLREPSPLVLVSD